MKTKTKRYNYHQSNYKYHRLKIQKEKLEKHNKENLEGMFKTLFNNSDFGELKELVKKMNYQFWDHEKIIKFIDFYEHWDNFQYSKIEIFSYNEYPQILEPLVDQFKKNMKGHIRLKKYPEEYILIINLINKSRRSYYKRRFNESILYLYRAMELITENTLEQKYKINTKKFNPNRLEKVGIDSAIIEKHFKTGNNQLRPSLIQQFKLLNELDDSIGKYYWNNREEIIKIINLRHSSLLVHGTENISQFKQKTFQKLLKNC